MGIASTLIGLLPTAYAIGAGLNLLVTLRVVQGIAVGGDGAAPFAFESAPKKAVVLQHLLHECSSGTIIGTLAPPVFPCCLKNNFSAGLASTVYFLGCIDVARHLHSYEGF